MHLRATYNNATKQFRATLAMSDGREDQVRFDSAAAFRSWLDTLEAQVEREQRIETGDSVLLEDALSEHLTSRVRRRTALTFAAMLVNTGLVNQLLFGWRPVVALFLIAFAVVAIPLQQCFHAHLRG